MSSYRAKHDKNNNVEEMAYGRSKTGWGLEIYFYLVFISMPRIDPRDTGPKVYQIFCEPASNWKEGELVPVHKESQATGWRRFDYVGD
jgi:hypothetical protein